MPRLILTFCLTFYTLFANALSKKDSLPLYNYKQLQFHYSNDLYHSTDRYLTQMAFLKYTTPWQRSGNRREYTLQQNVYTPSDIFGDTIQKNDRPYTALLFISIKNIKGFKNRNTLFNHQLSIGILGKHAFGEQTQRNIHYAVNSRQPLGWKYQLSDGLLLNAQIGIDKGLVIRKHFEYILHSQLNIGTVFNNLSAAQTIRIHLNNSYFPFLNTSALKSFRFSLALQNELKYVIYNGTLQGSIGSRHNIYTLTQKEICPLIYYQQICLNIAYRRLGITYSESYITKEFKTGLSHKWSTIEFTYLF